MNQDSFDFKRSIENGYSSRHTIVVSILKMACPIIITCFLTILSEQINFFFVGNLNDTQSLAAVGLGNMFINISAFALFFGMNAALETLVSQAYGAKNLPLCGVYLWRA
jgi:multidrug resistance protein, MATE family